MSVQVTQAGRAGHFSYLKVLTSGGVKSTTPVKWHDYFPNPNHFNCYCTRSVQVLVNNRELEVTLLLPTLDISTTVMPGMILTHFLDTSCSLCHVGRFVVIEIHKVGRVFCHVL